MTGIPATFHCPAGWRCAVAIRLCSLVLWALGGKVVRCQAHPPEKEPAP